MKQTKRFRNYKQKNNIKTQNIMKKSVLTIAAALFISGLTFGADNNDTKKASHDVSITIPTVALVDVEGNGGNEATSINLTPSVTSLEAGSAVDFSSVSDNSLWLNYTSIVEEEGHNNTSERDITVEIDNENKLPKGVSLLLSAGSVTTGNGKRGQAASGTITLGKTPKKLVTSIGSCYTESGYQKGHQLTYKLSMDNSEYANLVAKAYEVEVTFTITGD